MKHCRMSAESFAAILNPFAGLRPLTVLGPLAGIVASLAGALPARGGDVPFTEHVISTTADGPVSVFATDVDGDGDTDVLSASLNDGKIAWYQNNGHSPPTFTERVISTTAIVAESVFATDLDGDGDTDVLSASQLDDKIAWYESDGGSPPTFTEHVISTTAEGAVSVFATDVDGDGDIDVLSASFGDDKIAWYENTTPLCGNGSMNPGEECDGGLGCTDCLCDADFEPTAPPSLDCQPMCGNGSVDPGEDCDGPAGTCAAGVACQSDCTCPRPPTGCCWSCDGGTLSCDSPIVQEDCSPESTWVEDVSCGTNVCGTGKCELLGVPTVSTWGLVILALLLMVAGKVYFGRRRASVVV